MIAIEASQQVATIRVPPHSLEAEQSLLGSLLLDNAAFDAVGNMVVEADFYRHEHRLIFATIAELVQVCKAADVITVFSRMQDTGRAGELSYLNALAQCVASAMNAGRYAEIVREKALLRAIIAAADAAATMAWNPVGPVAETLDKIAASFSRLERGQMRKAPRSIAEIAIQRVDHYEALERGEVEPGWPTSIPSLDRLLNGGLRPGGLYILAARPKVGKSSLALSIAETMAKQGRPTLVLSQEMPDTEVADRSVAHAGRIDYSALMSGQMTHDHWTRATEALETLSRIPLYVDDQPALTLTEIRAKARMVKGLKVLVLDYLQLCSGSKEDDNRNTQIELITRGLKALAKNEGLAVVALSQLSRDVEKRSNKRPQLSDLRDSGAIEQDADVVLFLWPVREFVQEGRKVIGISVEANRQGPSGAFGLDFVGAYQRWGESQHDIHQSAPVARGGTFE